MTDLRGAVPNGICGEGLRNCRRAFIERQGRCAVDNDAVDLSAGGCLAMAQPVVIDKHIFFLARTIELLNGDIVNVDASFLRLCGQFV